MDYAIHFGKGQSSISITRAPQAVIGRAHDVFQKFWEALAIARQYRARSTDGAIGTGTIATGTTDRRSEAHRGWSQGVNHRRKKFLIAAVFLEYIGNVILFHS